MRLLVCDGHSLFAEVLALVLGDAGFEVVAITHSPAEALTALHHQPVDICVLDASCATPDLLDRLAELPGAAARASVVLLFGEPDPALATAAAARGVSGFAYKDQRLTEIIDIIQRVSRGKIVRSDPFRRGPVAEPAARREAHRLAGRLTPREREVLCRLVRGEDTNGVASMLGVSLATARSHIQSVLKKLGVHSRVEAAASAVRYGLVDPETGNWLAG
ncbi:MAG TPA: response regulator transcription factor [Planosporangium sp.]|jgi:DNA-binding NarL/FixJ family response regulator|nr:response regulator transcription factor [Planosporangium sp.]